MIELGQRWAHSDQVIAQETSSGLVLLKIRDGRHYSLNELGRRIWTLCDGSRDVSEIIRLINEEYDAPVERVRDDVIALLQELAEEGLVGVGDRVGTDR